MNSLSVKINDGVLTPDFVKRPNGYEGFVKYETKGRLVTGRVWSEIIRLNPYDALADAKWLLKDQLAKTA